jgi:hypothetical protein
MRRRAEHHRSSGLPPSARPSRMTDRLGSLLWTDGLRNHRRHVRTVHHCRSLRCEPHCFHSIPFSRASSRRISSTVLARSNAACSGTVVSRYQSTISTRHYRRLNQIVTSGEPTFGFLSLRSFGETRTCAGLRSAAWTLCQTFDQVIDLNQCCRTEGRHVFPRSRVLPMCRYRGRLIYNPEIDASSRRVPIALTSGLAVTP